MEGSPEAGSSLLALQETTPWSQRVGIYFREILPSLAFFIVIVLLWEISTTVLHLVPDYLLPAPSVILQEMLQPGTGLLQHTWVTLVEILAGYALGTVIGFSGALSIVYSPFLKRIIYPLVLLSQFVPKLAIAPLLLVWFGFTITPKVIVTALICMFPVLIDTVVGLEASDPRLLDLMYTYDANRWQIFRKIRLPTAMPHIFAGLKVGITLATIGAIVAEWISAEAGLGYLIVFALGFFQIERLFAALVMITLLGLFLFLLIVLLERLVSPHQPPVTKVSETA
jgi:ABC-type nitrate/sulfonate/bicarbonate transport system permease component